MPKPHTKKTGSPIHPGFHGITVRLNDAEYDAIRSDIADMVSHGATPVTPNAYCRHGALSYARLRRIEAGIRAILADDPGHLAGRLGALLRMT